MINQAFTQWSDNPVITTLETISAPIDEIQFPTITVCDQKPADNWGLIEKYFNSLAFQCSSPISNNCKESTKEIRKDFEFIIASHVEAYLELLNETAYKTLTEAPMFKGEIQYYNQSGVIDIVAEVLKQGKYEDLINSAIEQSATGKLYNSNPIDTTAFVIKYLFGANYTTDTFLNCTSEICKDHQENAVRILIMMTLTRVGIPFGSFITQFIHLNNYKSFGSCRHDLCHHTSDDMNIDCKKLDENEKKLHEYFTLFSKSFGFNESELLSLYELPGMLADNLDYVKITLANDGKKNENDFLLGDIPQAYLYSDCKEREHIMFNIDYGNGRNNMIYPKQFQQCYWFEDKLNETAIYISKSYTNFTSIAN